MNIPNMLTIFRLLLIPFFTLIFFSNIDNSLLYSIYVFLLAGFTDILDGYIARTYNLVTKWGIVMDPLADKLMLLNVLTCLVIKKYIPLWILIIILIKELSMIFAGILLYKKNFVLPSNFFGKFSTFLFYISIFILSFNRKCGFHILLIAVFSALVAFINYLLIFIRNKEKISP